MSLNKVQLIGYVGADPDVRDYSLGRITARFRLATNKWRRKDEDQTEVIPVWHSIVCWDTLAEYVQKNVKKGDKIYIEGELSYRTYKGPNNTEQAYTNIVASEIIMLKKKHETTEEAQ